MLCYLFIKNPEYSDEKVHLSFLYNRGGWDNFFIYLEKKGFLPLKHCIFQIHKILSQKYDPIPWNSRRTSSSEIKNGIKCCCMKLFRDWMDWILIEHNHTQLPLGALMGSLCNMSSVSDDTSWSTDWKTSFRDFWGAEIPWAFKSL